MLNYDSLSVYLYLPGHGYVQYSSSVDIMLGRMVMHTLWAYDSSWPCDTSESGPSVP